MILWGMVFIPGIAGILSLIAPREGRAPRWISLMALLMDFGILLGLWISRWRSGSFTPLQWSQPWTSAWGIYFHLGMDGLSLLLVALTLVLGVLAILVSRSEIKEKVGFFHFNLLWTLTGLIGVFHSLSTYFFTSFGSSCWCPCTF